MIGIPAGLQVSRSAASMPKVPIDHLPMALPVHHATKFKVTTTDFLVCPPTFLEIILMPRVCAAQNESAI